MGVKYTTPSQHKTQALNGRFSIRTAKSVKSFLFIDVHIHSGFLLERLRFKVNKSDKHFTKNETLAA